MIVSAISVAVITAMVFAGLVIGLVRYAYLSGLAEAQKLVAEEKQKRMEQAARSVQEFDSLYVDLLDEDLRHRLRNL